MVDFSQRARDLHCASDPVGEGQHSEVCPVYVDVAEERAPLATGYRNHGVVHRQSDFRRRNRIDPAVRVNALRIDRRATELADRGAEMLEVVNWGGLQLRGGRLQRLVHGGPQLVPHYEKDHERRGHDRERNRGSSNECQAGAEAHVSRNA